MKTEDDKFSSNLGHTNEKSIPQNQEQPKKLRMINEQVKDKKVDNFTRNLKNSKIQKMSSLPLKLIKYEPVNASNVTTIILVTYYRSGSSFLGDLLQQNDRTFYSFEPFRSFSDGDILSEDQVPNALQILQSITKCDYLKISQYVNSMRKYEMKSKCWTAQFLQEVCIRSPIRVIKTTRLKMKHAFQLINNSPNENIKIVYLVRDPRSLYNSRRKFGWCRRTKCSNITAMCDQMNDDLTDFLKMKSLLQDRLFLLKYENISLNAENEAKSLFKSLNIPFSNNVKQFISSHTKLPKNVTKTSGYSTVRDSKIIPFKWLSELPVSEIVKIQKQCNNVFEKLNYKQIQVPLELAEKINFK
ncbi:secreted protein-like protein [Leptotrombidium deliense]|uniref:Secreted protein-like protein n=1 Tax=Leptotrombidium deliense TaxID=299467 RepID=A0A443SN23_9ACAR|nr:secreted protein-like protein [Leptotrombidium deliense]